jgi:hypothetical protein
MIGDSQLMNVQRMIYVNGMIHHNHVVVVVIIGWYVYVVYLVYGCAGN